MVKLNLPGKNRQTELGLLSPSLRPLPAPLLPPPPPLVHQTECDCLLLQNIKEQKNCLRRKYWGYAFESSLIFK